MLLRVAPLAMIIPLAIRLASRNSEDFVSQCSCVCGVYQAPGTAKTIIKLRWSEFGICTQAGLGRPSGKVGWPLCQFPSLTAKQEGCAHNPTANSVSPGTYAATLATVPGIKNNKYVYRLWFPPKGQPLLLIQGSTFTHSNNPTTRRW